MLATVQFRIFCLPACHSEIYISWTVREVLLWCRAVMLWARSIFSTTWYCVIFVEGGWLLYPRFCAQSKKPWSTGNTKVSINKKTSFY
jgi:hypothetical protein